MVARPGAWSCLIDPDSKRTTGDRWVLTRDSWSGIPGMILSYIIRIKPLQVFPLPGSNPAGAFDFPQDWLTPQTSPAQRREGMERRVTMGDSWWLFCSFFIFGTGRMNASNLHIQKLKTC